MVQPSDSLPGAETTEYHRLRREAEKKIRKLQSRANRGLWALALFIAASIGAYRNFAFLPSLPENIQSLLGESPPTELINAALIVYTFSAIILILSRMTLGSGQAGAMAHVGYLTGFYVFYFFANVLEDNFWAVFAAGVTVLALANYHLWTYCNEALRQERESLAILERREKFFGGQPSAESSDPQNG